MADKQSQKAGSNSLQLQAQTVNLGIDEKRVREIVDEKLAVALQDFSNEASQVATQRNNQFNKKLVERMVSADALQAFADPAFQLLLIEAQKRAASTEREPDYDLLSELMLYRFEKGSNRNIRAGISRAVEVVDQVSDEALLGITVFHAVAQFIPRAGNLSQGLEILDGLFGRLIYADLPDQAEWLDHLDILDAVRLSSFGGTKLLEDFWYERFDGYVKCGIKENTEEHEKAKELLAQQKINPACLVKNMLADGYVKIEVLNRNGIHQLNKIKEDNQTEIISPEEIGALEEVYDLYDNEKISKEDFIKEIEKYENLKRLREWWNQFKDKAIQLTSVGRVLAHSNAQRVDKTLPPLNS